MTFNYTNPDNIRLDKDRTLINKVTIFKYLGVWIASSQNDFEICKALAWLSILKMKSNWNSKMKNSLKTKNFKETIEPILLYGSEC